MKSNTVILILSTLAIAGAAYWYFFTGTGNEAPLTAQVVQNEAQSQFKTLVSELQPITFKTDIFTDPSFTALINLSTPVGPEASGRLDPFSVIPGLTVR